jgi:hypothetical protein
MVWRFTERWKEKSKSSRVLTWEKRAALTRCSPPGLAGRDLLGEDGGQIGLVVPALFLGPAGERLGTRGDARGLHGPGQEGQLGGGGVHGRIPTAAS